MATKTKISIASDHAAFDLKADLKKYLEELGCEVLDRGANNATDAVDYPDYALATVKDILSGAAEKGILICGTGIGMSIAANRHKGIRAALVHDATTARIAAEHNHANIICLGARLIAPYLARILVKTWLDAVPEPRHNDRLKKLDN